MILTVPSISRPVDVGTFADITVTPVVGTKWLTDGGLGIEFASDLTALEVIYVRIRCVTIDSAEETKLRQAYTAYQGNANYLGVAAPSTAQVVAQVRALTQQMQGVIRILTRID